MKICRECGYTAEAGEYCPECGEELSEDDETDDGYEAFGNRLQDYVR